MRSSPHPKSLSQDWERDFEIASPSPKGEGVGGCSKIPQGGQILHLCKMIKLRTPLNIFDFRQFTRSELSDKFTISLEDETIVAIATVFRDES